MPAADSSPGLAHLVFFTLKDKSPSAVEAFVAACRKHLSDHSGTSHFRVGPRATAYDRPVNDREFDVALAVVFDSESAHDAYQISPRHQQFLAEQARHWSQVRIFDALV